MNFIKISIATLMGLATTVFQLTVPMFILTATFVVADVITAIRLQRRLAAAGKINRCKVRLSSARLGRIFVTLSKILGLLVLTALADHLILSPLGIPALKLVAGAICFWQALSILENEAAENDAPWAEAARKFLINKAQRYLDIN